MPNRRQSIRPDFVINNNGAVNSDPGTRTSVDHNGFASVLNFGGTNTTYASRAADSTDFSVSNQGTDLDNAFTIAFWINLNEASTSTYRFIWASWFPMNIYYRNHHLGLGLRDEDADPDQSNQFVSTDQSGVGILESEVGNWVHLVMAYTPETSNGAQDEKMDFYKNGVLWQTIESPNDSYDHAGPVDGTQYFGSSGTSTTQHTRAKLSNFLFYNHNGASGRGTAAVTAADVTEIYNGGRAHSNYNTLAKGADLVGYYKCDDDPSGGTIDDHSGLGNHFTTVNGSITQVTNSGLKTLIKKTTTWSQRRMTIPGLSSLRTNP